MMAAPHFMPEMDGISVLTGREIETGQQHVKPVSVADRIEGVRREDRRSHGEALHRLMHQLRTGLSPDELLGIVTEALFPSKVEDWSAWRRIDDSAVDRGL